MTSLRHRRLHQSSATNTATVVAAIALLIGALVLPGCLERKEKISIFSDGSAEIVAQFQTNSPEDLRDQDALPTISGGWEVDEQVRTNESGETATIVTARRAFAPGADLPHTFAARGDLNYQNSLQFPTKLTIERRSDGVYYHFRREYSPRTWAQAAILQEAVSKVGEEYARKRDAGEAISDSERRDLADKLVEFEVAKFEAFARAAFLDASAHAPQDAWLKVHEALVDLRKRVDYDYVSKILTDLESKPDNPENNKVFDKLTDELDSGVKGAIETALRTGPGGVDVGAFLRRFAFYRTAFDITEDLGDDSIGVDVTMPGTIVASNAESHDGQTAHWQFPGEALRDRKIELMVTSRLSE